MCKCRCEKEGVLVARIWQTPQCVTLSEASTAGSVFRSQILITSIRGRLRREGGSVARQAGGRCCHPGGEGGEGGDGGEGEEHFLKPSPNSQQWISIGRLEYVADTDLKHDH